MTNQFVARKGLIALDDSQITGSLDVSGSISASFFSGDGSGLSGVSDFPYTGSAIISGSLEVIGDITGSNISASTYYGNGSNLTGIDSGSWDGVFTGSAEITGSLDVTGDVSASTYYGDGSNLTGIETDPFPYTGSAIISGSLTVTGSISSTDTVTAVTGSFSHLKGNSPITVQDSVTFQSDITGSGKISLDYLNGTHTVIGNEAGSVLSSGNGSTFVGYQAGKSSTGPVDGQTLIGYRAGDGLTSGAPGAVMVGYNTDGLTNGSWMVGIGNSTYVRSTAGIAIGSSARAGFYDVSLGYQTGYNASTSYTISVGRNTGNNAGGSYHILIGDQSGYNISGTGNITLGRNSGLNLGGVYNTSLGYNSGFNTVGDHNIILGTNSGYNASGSNNILLGYQAGYNLTGSNQLIIANNSSSALVTGDFENNTFNISGSVSASTYYGDGSNLTGIDSGSWDGIFTGSAEITGSLDVTGDVSASTYYGDGSNLTGIDTDPFPYTGDVIITGSNSNAASASLEIVNSNEYPLLSLKNDGTLSLGHTVANTTEGNLRLINRSGDSWMGGQNTWGNISAGIMIQSEPTNTLYYRNLLFYVKSTQSSIAGVEKMRFDYNGNLGIGTSSPQERLHVNGNAVITGSNSLAGSYALKVTNTSGADILSIENNNEITLGTTPYTPSDSSQVSNSNVYAKGGIYVANTGNNFGMSYEGNRIKYNNGISRPTFTGTNTGFQSSGELIGTTVKGSGGLQVGGGLGNEVSVVGGSDLDITFNGYGGASLTSGQSWIRLNGPNRTSRKGLLELHAGTDPTNAHITLSTNTNERMRITHSGSVGIGLTDPQTNLHVSGAVSASTYYGDGSNLTGIDTDPFPYTGSAIISGSLEVIGNITGSLSIEGSGSTLFEVNGSEGQLFSITDSLSGSLFAVSDVSGLPILEVFSDDTVKIGSFNNEAITVNGSTAVVTGSFTGSFVGDGSNLTGIETDPFPYTGSAVILGSLTLTGSFSALLPTSSTDTYFVTYNTSSYELEARQVATLINPKVEYLDVTASISSGTSITLPNGLSYISSSTYEYLEVFFNGLRLRYDRDFVPTSTTTIQNQIAFPSGSELTFKSLKA